MGNKLKKTQKMKFGISRIPEKFYFAYGSNMNREQMIFRCPDSEVVAKAKISGFRFVINSRGVATIVPDENSCVWGIVWKISAYDEARLDIFEGVRLGVYFKKVMSVQFGNNRSVESLVYIAKNSKRGIPRQGYLERIIDGARFYGINEKYISEIERLSYV